MPSFRSGTRTWEMFREALVEAVKRLRAAQAKGLIKTFAVIGGFAVARWGLPRATGDLDFIIKSEESSLENAAAFLDGRLRLGEYNDPLLAVISFAVRSEAGHVPVQLLVFPKRWEDTALKEIHEEVFDEIRMPFIDWKALVLLKLYAGSALDLEDAAVVIKTNASGDEDLSYLRKKASSLRVSHRLRRALNS